MSPRSLYIFDLDGTLADLKHRRHFVERPVITCANCAFLHCEPSCRLCHTKHPFKPNWDAFHAACVGDKPIWPVIDVLRRLRISPFVDVWIWSGRMETVRKQTEDWLVDHIGKEFAHVLKMRPAGDYTPDDQLKESWLHALPTADRARLMAVFDDRQRVVDMWRRNSVQCFQVAPGDF